MFTDILRLSRQTLTYGLGTVLTRLVAFLLLPFFTHQLPPGEYAVYVLFYVTIAVAMEFLRLGLDIALLRFYVPEKDAEKRREVFSSIFWTAALFTTAACGLIYLFAEPLVGMIISAPQHPDWMTSTLRLCALILWLDNLAAFPLVVLRGEGRAFTFTAVKFTGAVVQVAATVLALAWLGRGVAGIFEANALASALVLALCLPTVAGRLQFRLSRAVLTGALAFGLPNVPTALFVQFVELADRKVLELMRTAAEVGLYSAGYRLGMFLAIVAVAFRFAWQPFFLQISDRPDARVVYGRVLTYYLAAVGWLYLLLTAFVEPLAKWDIPGVGPLIDPDYWAGLGVFPVVLLAHVFNGMMAVFMVGIYIQKRTRALPVIYGIAAVVNVVGNILLVPVWGMWASAWLTVVSYALMAFLLLFYIQRHYPIPYEWRRVAHLWLVGGVLFALGVWGRSRGHEWVGYAAGVVFPAVLLATGLATPGERRRLGLG